MGLVRITTVVVLLDNGRMDIPLDLELCKTLIRIIIILEWFCRVSVMDMELINRQKDYFLVFFFFYIEFIID